MNVTNSFSHISCSSLEQIPQQIGDALAAAICGIRDTFLSWTQYFAELIHGCFELDDRVQENLPPGIKNLGNTCFLNVALQSILSEPEFYRFSATSILQTHLTQQEQEPLHFFQSRLSLQATLLRIYDQMSQGNGPERSSLQDLQTHLLALGWQKEGGDGIFDRVLEWLFGPKGDSYYTYNFICEMLEAPDYSIGRPFGGAFRNFELDNSLDRSVIHLRIEDNDFTEALKRVPVKRDGQELLVRIVVPRDQSFSFATDLYSKDRIAGLANTFFLKQVHITKTRGSSDHTFLYRKSKAPGSEELSWYLFNDCKVSHVALDRIHQQNIYQLVFSTI